jgi:hypothetical protein
LRKRRCAISSGGFSPTSPPPRDQLLSQPESAARALRLRPRVSTTLRKIAIIQSMRRSVLLLVVAGALAAWCGGSAGSPASLVRSTNWPAPVRTTSIARPSSCAGPRARPYDYGWPIRPFAVQHPVRGNFGDPRTISLERLGLDDRGDPGDYSFHNGVDISATPGTPVFPVVSGVAEVRSRDEVLVHVPGGGRNFQYWHITARVHTGQHVVAYRTVLGTVQVPARHVHLSEIDGDRVTNPAGHLRPYDDHTPPVVNSVAILGPQRQALRPEAVSGTVNLVADAADTPPLPVPGAWDGFPITPATVQWTLTGESDRAVVPVRTVADFRRFEPEPRDFWNVYAAGTYQNFPVFDHHYFWRRPGVYLFKLTREPLDTRRLRNGLYRLRVFVSDLCGNRGTLTERIRIANSLRDRTRVAPTS